MQSLLISRRQIAKRVRQLARRIEADYSGDDLLVLPLLGGAFCFVADLVRQIHHPRLQLQFCRASSYSGTESRGTVQLSPLPELRGRRVLVVDDILDTGRTLARVGEALQAGGVAELRRCVLLDKPARRQVAVQAEYVGFCIPDRFVVGYGLDHDEHHRHLPDIHVLVPPLP